MDELAFGEQDMVERAVHPGAYDHGLQRLDRADAARDDWNVLPAG